MESGVGNDGRADDRGVFWLTYGRQRRQQTYSPYDCAGLSSDANEICARLINFAINIKNTIHDSNKKPQTNRLRFFLLSIFYNWLLYTTDTPRLI